MKPTTKLRKRILAAFEYFYEEEGFYTLEIEEHNSKNPKTFENLKFWCEEQDGGEGQGDNYWIVIGVEETKEDESKEITYWQIPGWYSSSDGAEAEIDNIFLVEKVEKTIFVWNEKK